MSGTSVDNGVNSFIKNNRFYLTSVMFKNPRFIFEKFLVRFINKVKFKNEFNISNKPIEPFRLMSIAVESNGQTKGIGSKLIKFFEKELVSMGIHSYGLSVRDKNIIAINFYIKNGFVVEKKSNNSIYYKKDILSE